jgi:hypothetical protein
VHIQISVADPVPKGLILEERIPADWAVSSSTPTPTFRQGDVLKWLFKDASGVKSQRVTYTLQVPLESSGVKDFVGHCDYLETGEEVSIVVKGEDSLPLCGAPSPTPSPTVTWTPVSTATPTPTSSVKALARRLMPDHYESPGQVVVEVVIETMESEIPKGLIVEEHLPSGWSILSASPGCQVCSGQRVKWVLFDRRGVQNQTLVYSPEVPAGVSEVFSFKGFCDYLSGESERREMTEGDPLIVPNPLQIRKWVSY